MTRERKKQKTILLNSVLSDALAVYVFFSQVSHKKRSVSSICSMLSTKRNTVSTPTLFPSLCLKSSWMRSPAPFYTLQQCRLLVREHLLHPLTTIKSQKHPKTQHINTALRTQDLYRIQPKTRSTSFYDWSLHP